MKKKVILSIVLISMLSTVIYGQVTTGTNTNIGPGGKYVGWNGISIGGAVPVPLDLRNGYVGQPIDFYNGGNPGIHRMSMLDGGVGTNDGRIIMSNDIPIGFIPQARLHLHQTGGFNNAIRFTTGLPAGASNGFLVGNDISGNAYLYNFQSDVPIVFGTENSSSPFNPAERLRINADNLNGFVGVGNTFNFTTAAQLHINDVGMVAGGLLYSTYGELFRTDGNDDITNAWRMYTGTTVGLTEKFNLTVPFVPGVPVNNINLEINTVQPTSEMLLQQNGNEMFRMTSAPGTGIQGPDVQNNVADYLIGGQIFIQNAKPPGYAFPADNNCLINMGGAIKFDQVIDVGAGTTDHNTILYQNCPINGNPAMPGYLQDGWRMKWDDNGKAGATNADCLIFEKTDIGSLDPDGAIRFTNTGNDGTEELSMTIDGNGFVGCGHDYTFDFVPWRRLSVGAIADEPQFRIHSTFSNVMNNEIYTDFQTTPVGDMRIDPRNTVGNLRTVFINYGAGNLLPGTTFPGVGLDINGQENIRTVNQDDLINKILVWNQADGNVRWRDVASLPTANVTANNGATIFPSSNNV